MTLVVFGLSISSSWGNGHATLWRGLQAALARLGHRLLFFERDVPYYAAHRDLTALAGGELVLYRAWDEVLPRARAALQAADAAVVTSYCPDALAATDLVLDSRAPVRAFYDLDSAVTLERAERGERVEYVGPQGLGGFDLVLTFTGGRSLEGLQKRFGARRVSPLYGSVDPARHFPSVRADGRRYDLSYLGTYAASRQPALERLFLGPARRLPDRTFLLGGSMYPADFPWAANVHVVPHVPPPEHPAFYGGSSLTLNLTRAEMAAYGYCPSGRIFEAAACGVPVISDAWEGLDTFFAPGSEVLIARSAEDVVAALELGPAALRRIGQAARARALQEHTAEHRARELLALLFEPEPGRRRWEAVGAEVSP